MGPTSGKVIYAGTASGVYKTTSGGTSWSSTGMPGGQTNAVLIDPDDHTTVYAGTNSSGVYKSTNSGGSWTQMNEGLVSLAINCLGINPGMYLFAGSNGGSMYRWSLCIGVEEARERVAESDVLCALPNPAKHQITIQYVLENSGRVDCAVYDIQGRLVRTLVSRMQSPGTYGVMWDGRDTENTPAPAGVYFCRLTTPYRAAIEKLIIMK
jgi:hypothetical protein